MRLDIAIGVTCAAAAWRKTLHEPANARALSCLGQCRVASHGARRLEGVASKATKQQSNESTRTKITHNPLRSHRTKNRTNNKNKEPRVPHQRQTPTADVHRSRFFSSIQFKFKPYFIIDL